MSNPRFADGHAGDAASNLSKGIPVGRSATVDVRNAHLSYVITWYANVLPSCARLNSV
jgi:cytochrome oxidase assembly protein ShyY1